MLIGAGPFFVGGGLLGGGNFIKLTRFAEIDFQKFTFFHLFFGFFPFFVKNNKK